MNVAVFKCLYLFLLSSSMMSDINSEISVSFEITEILTSKTQPGWLQTKECCQHLAVLRELQ